MEDSSSNIELDCIYAFNYKNCGTMFMMFI
jgi:hypothetical protein